MVVAIELNSFRLHDSQTMYNGRADVGVNVFNVVADGQSVFRLAPFQFAFPANAPYATTDITETKFRRLFINSLARNIAKNFYPYSIHDDFAADYTLVTP